MTDLALRPAVALVAALKKGEVGARELLDHYLARIERLNGALNAVVTLDVERARRAADAADTARTRGLAALGPLHGLPMTIKDTFETARLRTTAGATLLSGYVPGTDAAVVERVRAAGAVIFGKTNTPTYAADVQTYNPIFGITRNPWNRERTCGGSSGGSAVAIAAGLAGAEIGSDIGGSIRAPAHCCGIYGHKPTHGIVPSRGHIPGPPGTLAEYDLGVMGPLARSADDLALLLDVVAGPDAADAVGWRLDLPPPRRGALGDYRVAVWMDDPFCPVDAEVQSQGAAMVAALREAGVAVDERARPVDDLGVVHRLYEKLLWPILSGGMTPEEVAELARVSDATPPDDANLFDRFTRAVTLPARDWIAVDEERQRIRRGWADFFTRFDVLICPIWPVPAIAHDHGDTLLSRTIRVNGRERSYIELLVWAGLVTMALLPATQAPIGRTPAGLPVGFQIVGPYLEDRTTIDFARRLADVIGGYVPPPGV
ncbi:MAG: amidase [Deltaproteobacteria bacterium]|nr:amidase [Deltaproteobacteria bacterium]